MPINSVSTKPLEFGTGTLIDLQVAKIGVNKNREAKPRVGSRCRPLTSGTGIPFVPFSPLLVRRELLVVVLQVL